MEVKERMTSSVHKYDPVETQSELLRIDSPEPTYDTIVFCDENGAFSCLNPLIAYVASLFSSCLAYIQGLWKTEVSEADDVSGPLDVPVKSTTVESPQNPKPVPAAAHEVAAVAGFHQKWSADKAALTKHQEWHQEFSALCGAAKSHAVKKFQEHHGDTAFFLTVDDNQEIVNKVMAYVASFDQPGMDSEARDTHFQKIRDSLALEGAVCRCPGHPVVLGALHTWHQGQQHA